MIEMKSIEMYECQHCKKLFRTPDRHNCRRDPDYTNCYSCEHWGRQFYFDKSWRNEDCDMTCDMSDACKMSDTSQADAALGLMHENRWSMNCPDYKRKT